MRATVCISLGLIACTGSPLDEGALAPLPDLVLRDQALAILHANVIPMDRPRVLRDQTVLIRDGRIEALGAFADTPVPADMQVLDADGRFLMPGLADMHVHLAHQENLLLYLANGVTTIRNMWGSPGVLSLRDAIGRGEVLGPRIYTASRGLDGSPPYWETTIVVDDPASARAAVAAEAAAGYDYIKVYNNLQPVVFDAIADEAERQRIRFVGHVPHAVGLAQALRRGQSSTEHLQGYPVGADNATIDALAAAHLAADTWVCPTMIVRISFVNDADAAALAARDEMRFVHPDERARWGATPGAPSRAAQRTGSRARGRLLHRLKNAGVGILLGTDSWISWVIHGFAAHDELELLVEDAGFTPFEALAAATRDAARWARAETVWGTIAPGRDADLILLRGNPLDDVANTRARSGVMVRGTWLSQAELDRRLEVLADGYAHGATGSGTVPETAFLHH